MYLLSGDWHLTDRPEDEYRWMVFEHALSAAIQYDLEEIFILGDFVDRKDRHSAAFVNRLILELRKLHARVPVTILKGNHDSPLNGPAYWEFLSPLHVITYLTKPLARPNDSLLLLPFSPDPVTEWRDLGLSQYKCLMMHVTYPGALAENGQKLEGSKIPILPRTAKIYSGDVHTPQTIRNFVHVGAPHPVKFGDNYLCRFLLINSRSFEIEQELVLSTPRKLMLDISDIHQLLDIETRPGDQVKLRFNYPADQIENWGLAESCISQWAHERGITIASTELTVDTPSREGQADLEQDPAQLLREFAAAESISQDLLDVGLDLLNEARA